MRAKGRENFDLDIEECEMNLKAELLANSFQRSSYLKEDLGHLKKDKK